MAPPSDPRKAWYDLSQKAEKAFSGENFKEAETLYGQILDQIPNDHRQRPLFMSYHSECYYRLGRFRSSQYIDLELMNLSLKNSKIDHVEIFMEEVLTRRYEAARFHDKEQQYTKAIDTLAFALKVSKNIFGEQHEISQGLGDALSTEEGNLRRFEKAQKEKKRKEEEAEAAKQKLAAEEEKKKKQAAEEEKRRKRAEAEAIKQKQAADEEKKRKQAEAHDDKRKKSPSPRPATPNPTPPKTPQPKREKSESSLGTNAKKDKDQKDDRLLAPPKPDPSGRHRSHSVGADGKKDADKATGAKGVGRSNSVDRRAHKSGNPRPGKPSIEGAGPPIFDSQLLSENTEEDQRTDQWFPKYLGKSVKNVVNAVAVSWRHRVKIAILDTGFNATHPAAAKLITDKDKRSPGIKGWKSWVSDPNALADIDGHGTHCAMTLAQVADQADIYICRVFEKGRHADIGGGEVNEARNIAAAIRDAVDTWHVDIISMSFGFSKVKLEARKEVQSALSYAASKNVLLFAAASNDGLNRGRTFPARDSNVFCIHSTDAKGRSSGFNPPFLIEDRNFCILGERVNQPYRGKEYTRLSGTSVATPIAAGVAAMILHFVRQPKLPKLSDLPEERLLLLRSREGMKRVFLEMTDIHNKPLPPDHFPLAPWDLLEGKSWESDEQEARDRVARKIHEILQGLD